jgi:hypothetical protein
MSDKARNLMERFRQMARGQSTRWWTAFGALLASSAAPCPECGAPLALHIWPLLLLLVIARAMAGRRAQLSQDGGGVDHAGQLQGQKTHQE